MILFCGLVFCLSSPALPTPAGGPAAVFCMRGSADAASTNVQIVSIVLERALILLASPDAHRRGFPNLLHGSCLFFLYLFIYLFFRFDIERPCHWLQRPLLLVR